MLRLLWFGAAACLVGTFAWAAAAKILRPTRWRTALGVYRLPPLAEPIVFVAAPAAEVAVVALIVGGAPKVAGALSVALLCSFCAALLRARSKEGDRLPCGCFGGTERTHYIVLLLRNVALFVPSLALLLGPATAPSVTSVTNAPLPALLTLVGLAAIVWAVSEVARMFTRDRAG